VTRNYSFQIHVLYMKWYDMVSERGSRKRLVSWMRKSNDVRDKIRKQSF
jgi:hypothetical protein